MKKLSKIKLNDLSKSNLTEREMSSLQGGTYCFWDAANQAANEDAGTCSCYCYPNREGYYNADGLNTQASSYKAGDSSGWW